MIFDIQKAGILKRASAFLLDAILLTVLATGFAWAISACVGFNAGLDEFNDRQEIFYELYRDSQGMEFSGTITEQEYNSLSDELHTAYEDMVNSLRVVLNLVLIIISFGILLSYIVLELVVPLILKDGQTIGKRIFGIAVIRTDGVRMSAVQLFVRAILGKYTIETMVPVLLVITSVSGLTGVFGPAIILALLVLQLILLAATKTNSVIHDLLANTVTVDKASQMIFDTEDDMIEYKKRIAAKEAGKLPY